MTHTASMQVSLDKVKITRVASRGDGVFGTLAINNLPIAVTLERPWLDNKPQESCIPAGRYLCRRVSSPKFGNTFEVTNVPGRNNILFHKGNRMEDSLGCILLGENFVLNAANQCNVASSGMAYTEFMQMLSKVNSFELVISNSF